MTPILFALRRAALWLTCLLPVEAPKYLRVVKGDEAGQTASGGGDPLAPNSAFETHPENEE